MMQFLMSERWIAYDDSYHVPEVGDTFYYNGLFFGYFGHINKVWDEIATVQVPGSDKPIELPVRMFSAVVGNGGPLKIVGLLHALHLNHGARGDNGQAKWTLDVHSPDDNKTFKAVSQ